MALNLWSSSFSSRVPENISLCSQAQLAYLFVYLFITIICSSSASSHLPRLSFSMLTCEACSNFSMKDWCHPNICHTFFYQSIYDVGLRYFGHISHFPHSPFSNLPPYRPWPKIKVKTKNKITSCFRVRILLYSPLYSKQLSQLSVHSTQWIFAEWMDALLNTSANLIAAPMK